ncbi:hypothetical protein ACCQ10_09240 [Xanthomonas sp. NCPPB 1325]|uniref:hypothetical protein n=1 Tax=Xanthomonas sp. NCPPB 1325 TaxID=487529 RepID=UPI0035562064
MANKSWEDDGVGLGGYYLDSRVQGVRAGVHSIGEKAESHIWTPGCGFSPSVKLHESAQAAKDFAERRLAEIAGEA